MIKRIFHGKLFLSSFGEVHDVLDLGTGTGVWALELADAHPEATILGTDLSPIQPLYVPPNLKSRSTTSTKTGLSLRNLTSFTLELP
jgi:cyclopropane fatty-acyl-phospholipid synthase-like methyltransferase